MSGDVSRSSETSSAEFFEAKYKERADPWEFASKPEELQRYDAVVAALGGRRYRRAFEPGCSVGVLTERLAGICDAVEAVDFSPTAVVTAQRRCEGLANVVVRCGSITDGLPDGGTDLLVLSEIGYYFEPEAWRKISGGLIGALPAGATVVAAHWLGESADHRMGGDRVHEILLEDARLRLGLSERHEGSGSGYEGFRLERWERV